MPKILLAQVDLAALEPLSLEHNEFPGSSELARASVENEDIRSELERARALLDTQAELLHHLGERLDAQAELARLQIGLPRAQPAIQHITNNGGAAKPRLVRLRIAPSASDSAVGT